MDVDYIADSILADCILVVDSKNHVIVHHHIDYVGVDLGSYVGDAADMADTGSCTRNCTVRGGCVAFGAFVEHRSLTTSLERVDLDA